MELVVKKLEDNATKQLQLHRLCLLAQRQADDTMAWMFRARVVAKNQDELGRMQWTELQQFMMQQQMERRRYGRACFVGAAICES